MQTTIAFKSRATSQSSLTIDREAGVIRGVAVITAGMTRTDGLGNAPMAVDSITLKQVAEIINTKPIKVRQTHPELYGSDDLPHRLGYVSDARIVGDKVLADVTFHDATSSDAKRIFSIAESDPSSFGMSIVSSQTKLAGNALRLFGLDAVDFVGDPAANPRGLAASSFTENAFTRYATQNGVSHTMPAITTTPRADAAFCAAQDALLIRLGVPLAEFDADGRVVLDAGRTPLTRIPGRDALALAGASLIDTAEWYFRAVGPQQLVNRMASMRRPEFASLAMSRAKLMQYFPHLPMTYDRVAFANSTGDYPELLADTLGKAMLTHHATARRSWRAWAAKGSLTDFKPGKRIRVEDAPGLIELPEGASVEYGFLPESPTEEITLARYARGFAFTREAMINDDMQAFGLIPKLLGEAAARLEDDLAYAVLTGNANMADGDALFSSAHANTTTGTLTAANIGTAAALIARRTNTKGDILDMQPARLIVPTTLGPTAEAYLDSVGNAARWNGERRLELVTSPHLDADSSTAWYMTTDPTVAAPVEVAFLNGNEAPTLAQKSMFESGGIKIKATHEVAAKAIDYRAVVRSSGS